MNRKTERIFCCCLLALQLLVICKASEMSFKEQCIYWHNYYRRLHQVAPLTWSDDLAEKAQAFANKSAAANKFSNDGESSVLVWPGYPSDLGTKAVKYLYGEEKKYDYKNPGYSFSTGHFTVMVWKASRELGCAYAVNSTKAYVILKYNPIGNSGSYRDNVFPLRLPPCNATLDQPVTHAPCTWEKSAAAGLMVMSAGLIAGAALAGAFYLRI